jgi:hypothetical protein
MGTANHGWANQNAWLSHLLAVGRANPALAEQAAVLHLTVAIGNAAVRLWLRALISSIANDRVAEDYVNPRSYEEVIVLRGFERIDATRGWLASQQRGRRIHDDFSTRDVGAVIRREKDHQPRDLIR